MTDLKLANLRPYEASNLAAAIHEVLHWHRHQAFTREQRTAKDNAYIRLSEASARLDMTLRKVA